MKQHSRQRLERWDLTVVSISFYALIKAHRCRDGLLDNEDDVTMREPMSDKSDLSESDSDARPGSKRKARKRSAKVSMFVTHLARFDHIFSARDSRSGRKH